MRRLKITKSVTNRSPRSMYLYLMSEEFNIEEFITFISESERLISQNIENAVEGFQNMERNCRLAMCHLPEDESYEEMIAKRREESGEVNELRWLNARNVFSIAQEFSDSGIPFNKLLIAGMQGVKNAAFAYDFNPHVNFITFSTPIIRKHLQLFIHTGELPYTQPENEYEEIHTQAYNAHVEYCRINNEAKDYIRFMPPQQCRNMFASAKVGRCRKEIVKVAELLERKQTDPSVCVSVKNEPQEKYIYTPSYYLQDELYNGECKDVVKSADGEWYVCTSPAGERIAIRKLADRESMGNLIEALIETLRKLALPRPMTLREWRATNGR